MRFLDPIRDDVRITHEEESRIGPFLDLSKIVPLYTHRFTAYSSDSYVLHIGL